MNHKKINNASNTDIERNHVSWDSIKTFSYVLLFVGIILMSQIYVGTSSVCALFI